MHLKNGRPVKVGDAVVWKDGNGLPGAGIVAAANAGSETCNLIVVGTGSGFSWVTAREAVHLDDAMSPAPFVAPGEGIPVVVQPGAN